MNITKMIKNIILYGKAIIYKCYEYLKKLTDIGDDDGSGDGIDDICICGGIII